MDQYLFRALSDRSPQVAATAIRCIRQLENTDHAVRLLERLRQHHPAQEDAIGMLDELVEIHGLNDGGLGGAGAEGRDDAHDDGERLESKHFLTLSASERSVKRAATHDLD